MFSLHIALLSIITLMGFVSAASRTLSVSFLEELLGWTNLLKTLDLSSAREAYVTDEVFAECDDTDTVVANLPSPNASANLL